MTGSIHRSAVILSSLLFFSACEKEDKLASSSANSAEDGSGKPTKSIRTERRGGTTRAEREAATKEGLVKAFEAAQKETDPAARDKALAKVAWDALDIDREIADKAFSAITPGSEDARKLVGHFAMRMADESPEDALRWARELEQPAERDDAISRIAVVLSTTDPKRAAALALDEVPEGLPRYRAVAQIVQRWSQTAPADAGAWVSSLPEGMARKAVIVKLAITWSQSDAPALARWASTNRSLTPEVASAVAETLRYLPDEKARAQRLSSFNDPAFRTLVEEELKKSSSAASLGKRWETPQPPKRSETPPGQ